ncbi:Pre-SET motif-domain-containing protein [Flammula alnicola]|nr:Pre-SET motif-domain-containing protein [Flammula alnicola]
MDVDLKRPSEGTSALPQPLQRASGIDSDQVMDTDYEADVASPASPEMGVDRTETVPINLPAAAPRANTPAASSKVELTTPILPSQSSAIRKAPPASPTSVKKPPINRQGLNPVPVPPMDEVTTPSSKHKPQMAVKSASSSKRVASPSLQSASSNSDSDEKTSSRQASQGASSTDGGIDMRNLSDALGIAVPFIRTRTPESSNQDSDISSSVNSRRMARKTVGGRSRGQTLAEAYNAAGQSNAVHTRRGSAREMVIDLTSDHEEIPENSPAFEPARKSGKMLANALSTWKGKARAPASTSTFAAPPGDEPLPSESRPDTSRSGTDELLLRPAEPSPPPESPSPLLKTAPSPVGKYPTLNSVPAADNRPLLETRHFSAPSLRGPNSSIQSTETQARPSSSAVVLDSLKNSPPPLRPQGRPASMGSLLQQSVAEIAPAKTRIVHTGISAESSSHPHSPEAQISKIDLASGVSTAPSPPKSPKSPRLSQARISASSPILPRSSFSGVFKRATQERDDGTKPFAVVAEQIAVQQTASESISNASQDIDMLFGSEGGASSGGQSDDEAMQDAEEVQALVEDEGDMSESMPVETDIQSAPDGSNFTIPRDTTTSRMSMPDDSAYGGSSDAGPSRTTPSMPSTSRRSSRRSSRSSANDNWPLTPEDDFGSPVPASRHTTPDEIAPIRGGKTYGGFAAITWKDYRQNLDNFAPVCHYAKDLPHGLQDHVNNMSQYTRLMPGMRDLFLAIILENTVDEEHDAPQIEVQNSVDEEPTPPWEFYYTNKMWHGEGVPPPDIKSLVSCTCKGACNPRSKTCACLKRQREAAHDPNLEFAYDKNGKLKIPGYPIFECNDLCGCDGECRNRVGFQTFI